MKHLVKVFAALLLMVGSAWATTPTPDPITVNKLVGLGMRPELAEFVASQNVVLSNAEWLKFSNAAGSANVNVLRVDATDDTVLSADTGDVIKLAVAGTPIAALGNIDANGFALMKVVGDSTLGGDAIFAAGKGIQEAVAIITPDIDYTPAAANVITSKITRCVAGCPTVAGVYLPEAGTTTIGKSYEIINEGSYPLLVFPNLTGGTNTLNAAGAGTPISCATTKNCRCIGTTATGWRCMVEAVS